ncbi:hypothetical protein [Flavisolibacter tropicus]|uniref:Uncharacterized protein n=1 Tax=Flavisolibacter tropicus TaxID=1492898 RepID=A0A172TXP6_9BACT|nr:hypothetical protein [Flavisolibacter tropicus]ANE51881.1 hypothetical protein SY85_16665 [Flavisolibacter tropicus]
MHKVFTISLLLFSCSNPHSPAEKTALPLVHNSQKSIAHNFITSADSIVLISHQTYDDSPPDSKTGKLPSGANLLDSGRLNTSIIQERVRLKDIEAVGLGQILDEKVTDDIIYTACFDPHHTILAYKDNKISYIDLCFDCKGFDVHDFPFEHTMSYAKYNKLKAVFKSHRFTYMID